MKTANKKFVFLSVLIIFGFTFVGTVVAETITIQLNDFNGKDASVNWNPRSNYIPTNPPYKDTNYNSPLLYVSGDNAWMNGISLIQFALSSIPPSSTITSASLILTGVSTQHSGSCYHHLYQYPCDWIEDSITYNNNYKNCSKDIPLASQLMDSPGENFDQVIPVLLVQGWIDGSIPNHGFSLESLNCNNRWHYYYSSESSYPPELTVTYTVVDSDNDGILDLVDGQMVDDAFVDESGFASANFTDQNIDGTSFGYIKNPSDLTITVDDMPSPDGIWISASGDSDVSKAQIRICDLSPPDGRLQLTNGDVIVVTCGSMGMQVMEGPVELILVDNITVTVPTDAVILITEYDDGHIKIENLSEDEITITIDANGNIIELSPDESLQSPVADPGGPYLVAVDQSINFNGTGSSDPDGDSLPLTYAWSVEAGTVDDNALTLPLYTAPSEAGICEVSLSVTDFDGLTNTATTLVVVYDPDGGFVTGGGWIYSPVGAYAPDPSLTGKATFGFVSKYKKGASTPTGNTEFQFHAGDLNFHSDSYQWLVIAGKKAMYKGIGTINGAGDYGFMLSAIDEKLTPSTDVDLFRIRIWDIDNNDIVVYDNELQDADDADPTTEIQGGNIVIHSKQ